MVVSDDNNINVRVFIGYREWIYCPSSVTLVTPASDEDSSNDKTTADSTEFSSDEQSGDSDDDTSVTISSGRSHQL